jgi:ABC-2 type transport system ATP-binding protein
VQTDVEVHKFTMRFGTTIAMDNILFDVLRGEIFGFLGPNGAGKDPKKEHTFSNFIGI